ncbi:MAG TPA: T9SS type A sorting domain-containing protein [Candidatus Marinimicrobia bacterium]|nr:T9SS type A sorting domain-containing protein [Candidatus Neomarinimicrobiota bacterium]
MRRYFIIPFLAACIAAAADVDFQKLNEAVREDDQIHAWIMFKDKGPNVAARKQNITLHPKTLERRKKLFSEPVTWYDVPVHQKYINRIISVGVEVRRESKWLNALSVFASMEQIQTIAGMNFVTRIQPVAKLRRGKHKTINNMTHNERRNSSLMDYGLAQTQIEMMNCDLAHDIGYFGQGVRILVIDTGFDLTHEAFDSLHVIDQWDFINDDNNTANETDSETHDNQHNHGTSVLSIMGAYVPGTLIGPAFGSEYLLAKTEIVAEEIQQEEDNYVAALEWGEANGADVVNSSLGYLDWYSYCDMDGNTAITTIGVDIAASLGLVCVTSAGNWANEDPPEDPCESLSYYISAPADADSVIAVGAVSADSLIVYFSSRGPSYDGRIKPEVSALGVGVAAANPSGGYSEFYSGTSASSPLVAGVAAVLLSANPQWTNMEVREALMMTASQADMPNNDYGYGLVNIWSAIFYNYSGSTIPPQRPASFSLNTVYPNPFNPSVTLSISMARASLVTINIFDINGRRITTICNELLDIGDHHFIWNATAQPSGIYIVRSTAGQTALSQKITLIK